jgi:hypothetical protein
MNSKNKEKKMEQTNNKWLEGLEKGGLLYVYLVSLISSDSLFTVEDCEESLKEIDYCLEILPENDIKDKEKIHNMLLQGREIVLKDMVRIKKEN